MSKLNKLSAESGMAFTLEILEPLVNRGASRADLTMAIQVVVERTSYTKSEIRKIVADLKLRNQSSLPDSEKQHRLSVCINSSRPLQEIANEVIKGLEGLEHAFLFSGKLAIAKASEFMVCASKQELQVALSKDFVFYKAYIGDDGEETISYVSLPDDLLLILQSNLKESLLRIITHYTKFPVLQKSGDKYEMCISGYNPISSIFVGGVEIVPTFKQTLIQKVLSEFNFASEEDKTTAIAFFIIGMIHHLFPGQIPMLGIEGNQRNIGKTLLALMISLISQGKEGHVLSLTDNEDEMEKRICSIVKMGAHAAVFDNAKLSRYLKSIGGAFLERLITSPFLQFRLLGGNDIYEVLNTLLIIVTTNGIDVSDDIASRRVALELFYKGNPNSKKFNIKDLLAFVKENIIGIRSEILGMMIKWVEAGCPLSTKVSHRFQGSCEMLGGILETSGYTGFLSTQKIYERSSGTIREFEKCLFNLPKNSPLTAKMILDRCRPKSQFFVEMECVATFSKKILVPMIGQDFSDGDVDMVFESAGKNNEKSALYIIKTLSKTIEQEQDNVLLLPRIENKNKDLQFFQEKEIFN